MRPILIVHTWQPDHDNGANDTCRDTYLYTWGAFLEHRFAFDNSRKGDLAPDEIRMNVDSGLYNTSFKTRQAIAWAYKHNKGTYTHVCYAPTDCYIIVPRLLRSMRRHIEAGDDYWGFHTYDEHHIGGGSAYCLSRRGMEAVLEYGLYPDFEDRWVGSACRAAGLTAVHDELYRSIEQPYVAEAVTMHLSVKTGDYDPQTMRILHSRVIAKEAYYAGDFLEPTL